MRPGAIRLALRSADIDEAVERIGYTARVNRRVAGIRHRLLAGVPFPKLDAPKLWDAANVADLLEGRSKSLAVLDAGAYNSPTPWVLARRGFADISAIDLNPSVVASPWSSRVRYSCQDMQRTGFRDETFDVIVSGSTIEHGVDWLAWLEECRRLLKPGGLLYVSTDLVDESVTTDGLSAFGLPWNPLRPSDIKAKIDLLEDCGFVAPLVPDFEMPATLPMNFLGHDLGFIAFCTQVEK
jgi:SAM-dependent methyltransferase